jgi:GT2 family glycosyltransferase
MKTSVSIVLYYSDEKEILSIISILEQVRQITVIYLIDNGGSEFASKLTSNCEKTLKYIKAPGNIGYGSGHNIAIKEAEYIQNDLHIVMNSDIGFVPRELESFLNQLIKVNDFLIAGPNIINPADANLSYFKLSPSLLQMIQRLISRKKYQYNLQIENIEADIFHCPYLSGAFIVFNMKQIHRLGYFDQRFFMYPEDIDISLRASLLEGAIGCKNFNVKHDHRAGSKNFCTQLHLREAKLSD